MENSDKNAVLAQLDWDWLCSHVVRVSKRSGYNIKAICPYHDDRNASLNISVNNGLFYCHACRASGDFIKLICDQLNVEFKEAIELITGGNYKYRKTSHYTKPVEKPKQLSWNWMQINAKHTELLSNPEHIKEIENYGISLDIIKRFKLGMQADFDCHRMIIPIPDAMNNLIAVKMHRVTGNPKTKCVSAPGSMAFLYPIGNIMKSNRLMLIEGEPDTLTSYTNHIDSSLGVTPCTVTGGAMTFKMEWVPYFLNKDVYISYDLDSAGRSGLDKVISYLDGRANIHLFKTGEHDMRDFWNKDGTTDELKTYLSAARKYDQYHPLYIRRRLYPILIEACADRFKWEGLKREIDRFFMP